MTAFRFHQFHSPVFSAGDCLACAVLVVLTKEEPPGGSGGSWGALRGSVLMRLRLWAPPQLLAQGVGGRLWGVPPRQPCHKSRRRRLNLVETTQCRQAVF